MIFAKNRLRSLTLVFTLTLSACMSTPDIDPEKIDNLRHMQKGGVHAVYIENPEKPRLLFVHGSPGKWQDWAKYLDDAALRERYELYAIDRLGFGESAGPPVVELASQAKSLESYLTHDPQRPTIVVTWSHGGPIALHLAAQSHAVDALVLVASSMDPELEYPRWYNRALEYKLVQAILPKFASQSNAEMLAAPDELRALTPRLATIQQPIVLLQGGEDGLVKPETVAFASRHLKHADLDIRFIPEAGHALVWSHYGAVTKAIDDALEKASPTANASP